MVCLYCSCPENLGRCNANCSRSFATKSRQTECNGHWALAVAVSSMANSTRGVVAMFKLAILNKQNFTFSCQTDKLKMQNNVQVHYLKDDNIFPNNSKLPLLLYKNAIPQATAEQLENCFDAHGWDDHWRDGIYHFHHYHRFENNFLIF